MSIRSTFLIVIILTLAATSAFAQQAKSVEALLTEIDPWVRTDTVKIMHYIDSANQVTKSYIESSKYWEPVQQELSFLLGIDYVGSPQITNDGRIYFTMRITGDREALFYMTKPMGWPVQVTPNSWIQEGIGITGFSVHPNGKYVIVQTDVFGDEKMDLWYFDRDGKFRPLIVDRKVAYFLTSLDRDNPDVFYVNPYDRKSFRIARYNLKTNVLDTLYYEPGVFYPTDYYKGKMPIIRSYGGQDQQVGIYDLATNKITILTDTALFQSPVFMEDGKILTVTAAMSKKGELAKLCLLDPANPKSMRVIYDPPYEIGSFIYDRQLKRIFLNLNKDGYSEPLIIDIAGKVTPFPNTGIGIISGISTNDSGDVVFDFNAPTVPPTAYKFRLGETQLTPIAHVSTFGFDFSNVKVDVIRYRSEDGTMVPSLIYIPATAKKDGSNPAIIEYHGGPAGQSQPFFQRNLAFALSKGFIFMLPNVRGSTGYGPAWEEADNLEGRFKALKDAEGAIDYLINEGYSKPNKIAIWGASYGGYTVDWLSTQVPEKFAVAISEVGVSYPDHTIKYSNPVFVESWAKEYGPLGSDLNRRVAPIFNAAKVSKPILLTGGFHDPRVPPSDPRQFAYVLSKLGKPVWYFEEVEAGHGSSGKAQVIRDLSRKYVFTMMHLFN